MTPSRRASRGQVLPLFAILIPGMLALMALGIDAANVFLERRDAQGAADLAAVSGAKLLTGAGTAAEKAAAEGRAESIGQANGYAAADVIPNADYGTDSQIEVKIETEIPTYFMPILNVFGVGDFSKWDVEARAVAQADPGGSSSGDFALFALERCGEKEDFSALNWSGENNTITGSAHSNAGVTLSGNHTEITNEFSVTCTGSNISDKNNYNEGGNNPLISPNGSQNVGDCPNPIPNATDCRRDVPLPPIPFFDHGTRNVNTSAINTICHTTYSGDQDIDSTVNGNICALNGKLVIKSGANTTSGVTFFANEIIIGDEGITLDQTNEQGILFYAVTGEEGKGIDYSGNKGTFEGIWYSPKPQSKVQFQGNENDLDGALVGYRVDYSGNYNSITGDFGAAAGGPPSIALIE